jgi:hypothetical protein
MTDSFEDALCPYDAYPLQRLLSWRDSIQDLMVRMDASRIVTTQGGLESFSGWLLLCWLWRWRGTFRPYSTLITRTESIGGSWKAGTCTGAPNLGWTRTDP